MTAPMPEVDGRTLWEVVVRMETKLDVALQKLDDHEDRLRAAAPQAEVDKLAAKIDVLAIEQAAIKNDQRSFVTPKGLLTTMATTVALIGGTFALLSTYVLK